MPEDLSLSLLTILIPVTVTYFLTPNYINYVSLQKSKNVVTINYQGTQIITGGGLIILAALAAVQFIYFFFPQKVQPPEVLLLLYLGSITFLGLYDDLKGEKSYKGFRGHFQILWSEGTVSTGLYKAAGGLVLGTLISAATVEGPWLVWLFKGAFLALFSNFFNLLDTRPARAAKFFFLFSFVFILIYKINILPLFTLWSALYIYLFWEYKEKIMLGDAGAYLLGGALGFYLITVSPLGVLLSLTALLVVLHYLGEKFSFSRILENKMLFLRKRPAGKGN